MSTKQLPVVAMLLASFLLSTCTKVKQNETTMTDSTGHSATSLSSCDSFILCSGIIVFAENGIYHIAAPMPGIIKSVNWSEGCYVKAGSVLITLESNEILKLQQEYLETENQFKFLAEEYKRQGELALENATSMKKMQLAQRDFHSVEIRLYTLKAILENSGIRADSIKYNMPSRYIKIKAPRSGSIAEVHARPGMFAELGDDLLLISDNKDLLVKLFIPEALFQTLQKGQEVELFFASDSNSVYEANIHSLAHSIDPENHTAEVFARISTPPHFILPGMAVNAKISTKTARLIK